MHITAQGPRFYCVEWDVKLYYTIPYPGGAATETESIITWKDTGCEKSLLISYGIHKRRRFAFEVNSEHGSVQGWDDYSSRLTQAGEPASLASRKWRRRRNYHSLMSPYSNQAAHNCLVSSTIN